MEILELKLAGWPHHTITLKPKAPPKSCTVQLSKTCTAPCTMQMCSALKFNAKNAQQCTVANSSITGGRHCLSIACLCNVLCSTHMCNAWKFQRCTPHSCKQLHHRRQAFSQWSNWSAVTQVRYDHCNMLCSMQWSPGMKCNVCTDHQVWNGWTFCTHTLQRTMFCDQTDMLSHKCTTVTTFFVIFGWCIAHLRHKCVKFV